LQVPLPEEGGFRVRVKFAVCEQIFYTTTYLKGSKEVMTVKNSKNPLFIVVTMV
jgi:hypothetical protein